MRRCHRTKVLTRRKLVATNYNRMVAHFAYVQTASNWQEWSFRTISLRQAEILEAAGEVEKITRFQGNAVRIVGFRALKPTCWERPSPTTLTLATMNAVANSDGKLTRHEEMEVIKFIVWPLIGDTKATCVRPPMTTLERRHAEKIMASGKLQAA